MTRFASLLTVLWRGFCLTWRGILKWHGTGPTDDRTSAEVAAFVDDVIVRVIDLTPDGAVLYSPVAFEPGRDVELLAHLPLVDGGTRSTRLHLIVKACRPEPEAPRGWRIGGRVVPCDAADRDALLGYSRVAAAHSRPSDRARVHKPGTPPPDPGAEPARELDAVEQMLVATRAAES